MDAARGESVTRANFPKSSPSWSVHTTPWHTQMNTQLCSDTCSVYKLKIWRKISERTSNFLNHFCISVHVRSIRVQRICLYTGCVVYEYNPLSQLITVMSHDELCRVCQTHCWCFPALQGAQNGSALCRSDELHILLHYIQIEYHQMKQKTRTTLKYQTKEHKQVDGWKPFKRTHTPFHR